MSRRAVEEIAAPAKPYSGRLVGLCAAAWACPGLGHWMLGKRGRAMILFGSILTLFIFGLLMRGDFFYNHSESYLEILGYYADMCVGLARPVASFFGYSGGDPFFASSDYGTAFLIAAGMLNVLCILDTY